MQRFWDKVEKTDSCWIWKAYSDPYGRFYYKNKTVKAHRFAYESLLGKIPEGLETDHLCLNKKCVNPHHLEMVTKEENLRRNKGRKHKLQTYCINGHKFNEENTYIRPDGHRNCRVCDKLRQQSYRLNS